ncbi:aminopeptidase N [Kytococcus schroeteri]|uniref:Aminopeptidase N n=2 Tax=Kytococcus TaxID=57499 RepID=A0A2I1P9P2_9MICO|nr:aminopeptidase N [Kytococcus schroeteri]PKZ41346.1 aminopeptidase N [Kytococcus schroeteri]
MTYSPTAPHSSRNLTRAEAAQRASQVSDLAYRVEIDCRTAPDAEATTFGTTTTLDFTSTAGSTFLDFLGGVDAVTVDGEPLNVESAFDGARIQLPELSAGRHRVVVQGVGTYGRTGQGLHRFIDPADGRTYLYTHFEPADCRRLYTTFEQPDLKAAFTWVITAPTDWVVRCNAEDEVSTTEAPAGTVTGHEVPAGTTREWAPTLPMSTYITAMCAGEYHRTERTWTGTTSEGEALEVPVGLLCRQSLVEHFDADEVFDITFAGLDFFHRTFGVAYPWGTYDQVFVPEYNLGAMENPGCVTFTENYVFRSTPTRAQRAGRANTILHEMAHMWFGDLVTMEWWNDLWLKESFAELLGTQASADTTEFTDAWVAFSTARKLWAYRVDQLPSTHPVVAQIDDLEAARQNFDGITYAKGAALLQNLMNYVGREQFFAGSTAYFREHAYGNTTLPDLLRALEEASGRDLDAWVGPWLRTAGVSTIGLEVDTAEDGTVTAARLTQHCTDPVTGEEVLRPHRLAVGTYTLTGGRLQRTGHAELDLAGESVDLAGVAGLEALVGAARPDLVLVNDGDLTYAKLALDEHSTATLVEHLGTLEEDTSRSTAWWALWDATRDGRLHAAQYVRAAIANLADERHGGVLGAVSANARAAIEGYLPAEQRDAWRAAWAEACLANLRAAEPGSDAQLVWQRAFGAAAATHPASGEVARGLLEGTETIEGLAWESDRRWDLWTALAATGQATREELDAELEAERNNTTITRHLAAVTSLPGEQGRREAWERLLTPLSMTNDHVSATIEGMRQPLRSEELGWLREEYFGRLEGIWADHAMEIAERIVPGTFPEGEASEAAAQEWLTTHPEAPAALRRIVADEVDGLRRSLRAQRFAAEAGPVDVA